MKGNWLLQYYYTGFLNKHSIPAYIYISIEVKQRKIEDFSSFLTEREGIRHYQLLQYVHVICKCFNCVPLYCLCVVVIPAGDTHFLLRGSSQPQYFNWEKYGMSLSAPEGILPPSETCEVAITALAGGEFEFPKGSELVSAIYAITISRPLLKPLTINIQHCVRDKLIELQQSLHLKGN